MVATGSILRRRKAARSLHATCGWASAILSSDNWQNGWLGSRMVNVLDSGAGGPGSNRRRDAVG